MTIDDALKEIEARYAKGYVGVTHDEMVGTMIVRATTGPCLESDVPRLVAALRQAMLRISEEVGPVVRGIYEEEVARILTEPR